MKGWMKLTLYLLTALFLMGCALEALYLDTYIESKRDELETPAGTDPTPITFTIEPGQSVAEIAGNLKARGLISDTELFRRYLQQQNLDAAIQAGSYTLDKTMTIPEITSVLREARTTEQQVTVPEGKRLEEIATIVSEQTSIASDDFVALAQTGWRTTTLVQDHSVLAQLPITATLEGFLFPDTYRLPAQATAYDLVDRMLTNFGRQVDAEIQAGFQEHGLSLYEGITLASIVEREAVVDSERTLIAGVYHNRLEAGWFLSADPTVQYALGYQPEEGVWWKRGLSFADLEIASPYNTYRNIGLPPSPIANPGIQAIRAAARPAETDYFFFMVECEKDDGSHVFAVTEEEHLANYSRCGGFVPTP
ncbi:MAG: endolytic transglycosylase MltG [Anaerolineae bacterium]